MQIAGLSQDALMDRFRPLMYSFFTGMEFTLGGGNEYRIGREELAIEVYRELLPLLRENEYMYDTINNILLDGIKDLDEFRALLP